MPWQPSASLPVLQQRALLNKLIRQFFSERHVLEIDVPVLSPFGTTDLFIESLRTEINSKPYYLQTSPEFFLKRFLAENHQDIYYLGKAFRQGELGRRHQPEFTMLEWYRIGYDEQDLMVEVSLLLQQTLPELAWHKQSYGSVFEQYTGLNPHTAELGELQDYSYQQLDLGGEFTSEEKNVWLDLLFSHCVEPHLEGIVGIYDYPRSQAALARVERGECGEIVAKRFEVFVNGMELANGYFELADGKEQQQRFSQDQKHRAEKGLPSVPYDQLLVDALSQGDFPSCAGVALGVDRLLMLMLKLTDIRLVTSFSTP